MEPFPLHDSIQEAVSNIISPYPVDQNSNFQRKPSSSAEIFNYYGNIFFLF